MKGQIDTEMGKIIVDEDVLGKYAGSAAVECFGVVGMASVNMKDGIVKLLRRDNIRQRQAEGIAAAKAKGVRFGRPPIPLPENFSQIHSDWRNRKITLREAAETCAMPVGTFYAKAVRIENEASDT